ncbi:MAG TPA: LLM class flavin-dependent oxidoreductase [Candidatus Dormibacteraeota bacterium]|nr:LLM class flavin-dependent oxidoreductase [Candidatus Dormibacteraeota bacterium]
MNDLQLGINLWSQAAAWDEMVDAARRVDRLGYDSLWTWDHLYAIFGDPHQPILEGYAVVTAWAMATERVRLGLMVGANTFRNPGLVAKAIATLDHVSAGRAVLGLGGAWFELEHQAHGIDFGSGFGQRLDWLDEAVAACRTLLDGGTVTSSPGGHYAFRELRHAPRPVQAHLPIMIGGTGRRKTLRTLARYGDEWNGEGSPQELGELVEVIAAHGREAGRDVSGIRRTANIWMVIRDDPAEARRVWAAQMAHNTMPLADSIESDIRPLLGPVEYVAEVLADYVAHGIPGAIVELPAPYDTETLERLIGEVKPLVDAA